MTLRELEIEIWVARGFDRECVTQAVISSPYKSLDPNMEIPPDSLEALRKAMGHKIGEVIQELSGHRNN